MMVELKVMGLRSGPHTGGGINLRASCKNLRNLRNGGVLNRGFHKTVQQ